MLFLSIFSRCRKKAVKMDISCTCYCSQRARGGQRALILSAQICCTQVFSGEVTRVTLPSLISITAPRLLLHYCTSSSQQNGSRIWKLCCAQVACEKWTKTWVGACGCSSLHAQRQGESGFSSATESSFGEELRFAVVVKHLETLCVWKVLCTVMLPCNVTASCHPKET